MQTIPESASADPELDASVDAVIAALMSIGRLMKSKIPEGLDPGTIHLLHTLRTNPSLRVTDLATTTRLDVSTVSRHVQSLEKRGLVQRHPHPDDGRAQAVDVTDEGGELLDRAVRARRTALTELLSHWDRDRVTQLADLLTAFTHDVENRTELEQS